MHEHEWNFLSEISEGSSVDTYCTCKCGKVRHVYQYTATDPKNNVRYENFHEENSWTSGYAHGMARMAKEYAHIGGLE